MNKKIISGDDRDRSKDKIFKMTLIPLGDGEIWNDDFATSHQTESAALSYAKSLFPFCAVVPARKISSNPRGVFLFGVAIGFAAACLLIGLLTFITIYHN